ncbi:MAG: EAL domain-containing protein [Eubacterium sp.]|nr:EAL domain-containing protein [Eubacterium sp.]
MILIQTTYINRTRSFSIFFSMLCCLFVASVMDILYHVTLTIYGIHSSGYALIYIARFVYHFLLYGILFLYVWYITEVQKLNWNQRMIVFSVAGIGLITILVYDMLGSLLGFGFRIDNNVQVEGFNEFIFGYVYFVSIIVFLLIKYRNTIFRNVMIGFYGSAVVSFLILGIQVMYQQTSFTVSTFLLPIICMFYLLHSNPYDVESGAVSLSALEDLISYNYRRNREMIIISLYMKDFEGEGKHFPKELRTVIRRFAGEFFKGAVMFQVNSAHVILIADTYKNPDYENRVNRIINAFLAEYERFQYKYKLIIGKSIDEISRRNEYVGFIKDIMMRMEDNDVHFIEYSDVTVYNKHKYILDELGDIYRRRDMNDSRIEVYCQPVYNVKTKKYDTAEALMRLKLPEIGMVFPDQFIHLAEEYGYIHVLSLIILQKTCAQIRKLIVAGYEVKRISVNISVLEMRDENFCNDINAVIKSSGIPDDKIAIEVTESQNESDFIVMKAMINELKEHGIKFYLDDFGTGYSNFERIMELPFDIIKFDRSLVIASGEGEKSEKMVESLANMFANMNYSVLYEGVENELDEKMCIKMSASYLQGYKYSRPIPIERLTEFFDKRIS